MKKAKKKKYSATLKLSKAVVPHLEIFKQYAEQKGVSVEDVIDEALGEYIDEVVKKGK